MHYLTLGEEMDSYLRAPNSRIFAGKLLSLYDMIYGCNIKTLLRFVDHLSVMAYSNSWETYPPEQVGADLIKFAKDMGGLPLPSTGDAISHYLSLGDPADEEKKKVWLRRVLREICEDILRHINTDATHYTFVALAEYEAKYYSQRRPFGTLVHKKFPEWRNDIIEAMKCCALERYPASAYHVSVVMENAARYLAKKVRITPPQRKRIEDLTWQTLSDMITKKIQTRSRRTVRQRAANEALSEANNHLWDVKEAYRNKIAHGKILISKRARNWQDEESRLTYVLLQQAEHFLKFLARIVS